MDTSADYRDLLKILNKHKAQYLIIGAYAVTYYSEPRFTKDLDIWVKPDLKNAEKLYAALKEFGAPLKDINIEDFTNERLIYQIGVAPIRVDIIMGLSGVNFDIAWKKRVRAKYADVSINIIGKKELVKSKKNSNRLQDRIDLCNLEYRKAYPPLFSSKTKQGGRRKSPESYR